MLGWKQNRQGARNGTRNKTKRICCVLLPLFLFIVLFFFLLVFFWRVHARGMNSIWFSIKTCLLRSFSFIVSFHLVGGIPTPLKNMKVKVGWLFPVYGKIDKKFQTTNQSLCVGLLFLIPYPAPLWWMRFTLLHVTNNDMESCPFWSVVKPNQSRQASA